MVPDFVGNLPGVMCSLFFFSATFGTSVALNLRIHTNEVVMKGNEDLFRHCFKRAVVGKREMEEASRSTGQHVVLLDRTTFLVFVGIFLDLEGKVCVVEGGVSRRQPLLTPAEDDEFLLVFFRDLFKELPEVLDELAIFCVVGIVFGISGVATKESNIRLAATTNPCLKIIKTANVEHTLRDNLTETTADGLHLGISLSEPRFQSSA